MRVEVVPESCMLFTCEDAGKSLWRWISELRLCLSATGVIIYLYDFFHVLIDVVAKFEY